MIDPEPQIRPPQQQRSRASFERVVEAATQLLHEEGYPSFTLAEVSRRAHVSIGSIYARVSSKDTLFYAIQERVLRRIADESAVFGDTGRWERLSTRKLVIEAVRELAAPFRRHTGIIRVIMHRGAVDEVVASRGSAAASALSEQFKALLLTRRREIIHPDPELAVDVAYRMAYCTVARQVMYGPTFESQRLVEWDELVHQVGLACAAYLLTAPPVTAHRG
jgi:AcrR family transcriptional regulator